jgi:hypothetical protein
MDLLDVFWGWVESAVGWLERALYYITTQIVAILQYMWQVIVFMAKFARDVSLWLLRGLKALGHLNFSKIWTAIKRGWDRFRRALEWYNRTIMEPFDKLRRQIWDIYRRYFRPLLLFLDQFRVITRVLAIFNRNLAAKLDARLYGLERKLMWPITEALKRINAHTSYIRALITASGYLDRILVLETLRRDALLVWEVLTNPLGRIYAKVNPPPKPTRPDIKRDFLVFLETGGGPAAAHYEENRQRFLDTLQGLR